MADGAPTHDPQPTRSPGSPPTDTHDLALALAPALRRSTDNRLGAIDWFRAAWQRGGAATGFSTYRLDDGTTTGVLVKFPVGPAEHRWTVAMGEADLGAWTDPKALRRCTPRVVASGTAINGYDLAWIVTERLHGPALSHALDERSVLDLLGAAADFHACAADTPLDARPAPPDWDRAIKRSRTIAKAGGFPEATRWCDAVKKVQKALPLLRARWESREVTTWCHGDLHPGNVLRRRLPDGVAPPGTDPSGPCVLIDLALVHPGHWLEDALYLERQFWGHEAMLHGVKPLTTLARLRRERGLPCDDEYGDLANVRRVLMAACAPALVEREGNPKYLHSALEHLERLLPQAVR